MKTIKISLLFLSLALAACNQGVNKEQVATAEKSYQDLVNKAGRKPEELKKVASTLVSTYSEYAQSHSEEADEYLYKAAQIYQSAMNDPKQALATYEEIIQKHPESEKAAKALFNEGFIYNNTLKDVAKAKEKYEAFLKKYPNHQLASSVQFELENLGLSQEEVLQRVLKRAEEAAKQK